MEIINFYNSEKKAVHYELPFFYLNFLLTFFSSPFGITSQKSDNFPVRPSALQSSLSMRLNFLIINAVATRATAPAATPITTDFFMINFVFGYELCSNFKNPYH